MVIVCGETGSGKSTQLPKFCLSLGRGAERLIGHTQPRRLAARNLALRLSEELGVAPGTAVGYQVRFTDTVGPQACVKVMTDGILLAELERDPRLLRYDTIIVDEAHERSLNIDLLLGFLKGLVPRRLDLKVIVTSATIDAERFAAHFDGAPVIEVSGRSYPIEIRYRPVLADEERRERDLQVAILRAVDELVREGPGDVLVFLPGEHDIHRTAELLRRRHLRDTEILPLYARLSAADQQRAFAPHTGRRIVLATNVAETSITVPGIRYVIDTGLARISRYAPGRGVKRLPIEPVARANADQRAGRCGRMHDGICLRLYEEKDYAARPRFAEPEVRRTSLAGLILRMTSLRVGPVEEFPWLDGPEPKRVRDGYRQLTELGALDEEQRLTPLGARLARFPLEPAAARMLLAAHTLRCLTEVTAIVAALAIPDPREAPAAARETARAHHRRHAAASDFLALLALWNEYTAEHQSRSQRQLRRWCEQNFLSYVRMREWIELRNQIKRIAQEQGLHFNDAPAEADDIHRALLSGLLANIACRNERGEYLGTRGKKLSIHPASILHGKAPAWIMAAELVETEKLSARGVAAIEPEWIEALAGALVQRAYLDPRWDAKRGQVVADEQLSLFGLIIVPRRRVHYGSMDHERARAIFIRHALVGGEIAPPPAFLERNRALLESVRILEHKSRRADVVADDEALFAFYDERLPEGIFDARSFARWLKEAERREPALLRMNREQAMRRVATEITPELFPDHLEVGGNRLTLSYYFSPGHPADGVTVTIPAALLPSLPAAPLTWPVPGRMIETITLLIRGLPKPLRRHYAPAGEHALKCLDHLDRSLPFIEAVAAALRRLRDAPVSADDLAAVSLPAHLKMKFRIADDNHGELAFGDDLEALRRSATPAATGPAAPGFSAFARERIVRWDFGTLPRTIETASGALTLAGHPALAEENGGVALRVFPTEDAARTAMRAGLARLLLLELPEQRRHLEKGLPGFERLVLDLARVVGRSELQQDLVLAVFDRLTGDPYSVRDAAAFETLKTRARRELAPLAAGLVRELADALAEYRAARPLLDRVPEATATDVREQTAALISDRLLRDTPPEQLAHLPRYLKAARLRLERLRLDPARDARKAEELKPHLERYRAAVQSLAGRRAPAALERYRWLLEEFRVSLFAQELKTAQPVSAKRLDTLWTEVQAQLRTKL